MRFLYRFFRRLLFVLLIVGIVFGTFVGYLMATTAQPRAAEIWKRFSDLPHPRGEGAAAIGSRLPEELCEDAEAGGLCQPAPAQFFVIGGLAGLGKTVGTVDIFDPQLREWFDGPPLPEARHHPAAVGLGGAVYVSGGSKRATDWTPEPNLWRLLPTGDEWERLPDMPEGRMGHQMVAYEQKLYVIGGRGDTSNVLIYDTFAETWSTGAEMPVPRDHLGAALVGIEVFAIGGRDDAVSDRVDVYDIVQDEWRDGPPLPRAVSGAAVGAAADGIHVVGGEDPKTIGGGVIDVHFILRPGSTTWEEIEPPILVTHGSATGILSGSMLVVGGARRQGAWSPISWTGVLQVWQPALAPAPSPSPTPTSTATPTSTPTAT